MFRDGLLNDDLSLGELNLKVWAPHRIFSGARSAGGATWPAGSTRTILPKGWKLKGLQLTPPKGITIPAKHKSTLLCLPDGTIRKVCYYYSKSKTSKYQLASNLWARPFDVRPLSERRLTRVLGKKAARLTVLQCCPARAHICLEGRLRRLAAAGHPKGKSMDVSIFDGKRSGIFMAKTFAYADTKVPSPGFTGAVPIVCYLTNTRLSTIVKEFHNKYLTTSCGRIAKGQDFESSYWRHNFAVHAEVVGCTAGREARLTQEDPALMWKTHYGKMSANPGFVARWLAAGEDAREQLSVEERLCL